MKKYILILSIVLIHFAGLAQVNDNPIEVLSEKLYQNEMLSNRFFRNFVFIKTNTFKKKVLADMDKSLAKFDDNLSYVILHLPQNKDIKENYIKLQNYWNVYRINITNYDAKNYKSLIGKTQKLNKLISSLITSILRKHPQYGSHKKMIEMAQYNTENTKTVDNIAIAYILKNGLEMNEAFDYFDIDFGSLKKGLKKLGKNKNITALAPDLVNDLKTNLETIQSLLEKENYNPKMMYSNINNYSKKSFKLLDIILKQ